VKRAAAIVLTLLLASCAAALEAPVATDSVKDAATAIKIGQEVCLDPTYLLRARAETNWHAELHQGFWEVWEQGRACRSFGTRISAATGKPEGTCSICVA
jgi:hypothetical protein